MSAVMNAIDELAVLKKDLESYREQWGRAYDIRRAELEAEFAERIPSLQRKWKSALEALVAELNAATYEAAALRAENWKWNERCLALEDAHRAAIAALENELEGAEDERSEER